MPCDKIGGVITVTNRLLLAPDGFTVAKGAYGMFGRAVISSRLGARSVSEVTPGESKLGVCASRRLTQCCNASQTLPLLTFLLFYILCSATSIASSKM
jgi:hypothetical protein